MAGKYRTTKTEYFIRKSVRYEPVESRGRTKYYYSVIMMRVPGSYGDPGLYREYLSEDLQI